jgi:hypothetical protein
MKRISRKRRFFPHPLSKRKCEGIKKKSRGRIKKTPLGFPDLQMINGEKMERM